MGKTDFGELVKWGVIGGVLFIGLPKLAEWVKGLFGDGFYGYTQEQLEGMVITPETTEQIWEEEGKNVQELLTFQEEYNTTEIANAGDINKLNELKSQYEQNVIDFNKWNDEEYQKWLSATNFVNINKLNPVCMINPACQISLKNAESQVIDSNEKMKYYRQQIDANQKRLDDVNKKILQFNAVTTPMPQPTQPLTIQPILTEMPSWYVVGVSGIQVSLLDFNTALTEVGLGTVQGMKGPVDLNLVLSEFNYWNKILPAWFRSKYGV